MKFTIERAELNDVIGSIASAIGDAARAVSESEISVKYVVEDGWHCYVKIYLTNDTVKGVSRLDAKKCMKIFREYIRVANVVTRYFPDSFLLEAQGQVIHFFVRAGNDVRGVERVRAFVALLSVLVNEFVDKAAGDDLRGVHYAADFGRSIISSWPSVDPASKSVVSLGNCANAPAKKMDCSARDSNVCRPFWIRSEFAKLVYKDSVDGREAWFPIETGGDALIDFADPLFLDVCRDVMKSDDPNSHGMVRISNARSVKFSKADEGSSIILNSGVTPLKSAEVEPVWADAIMCRADLDGFTHKVKVAFDLYDRYNSDAGIVELLRGFMRIVACATETKDKIAANHDAYDLSWAGDCAGFILVPAYGERFSDFAAFKPVVAAKDWHRNMDSDENRLLPHDTHWTFAPACGEVLVLDAVCDDRSFRLVTGAPSGISQQAVNIEGARKKWSVMHKDDVNELDDSMKGVFRDTGTLNYKYATYGDLCKVEEEQNKQAVEFSHRAPITRSRPHCNPVYTF